MTNFSSIEYIKFIYNMSFCYICGLAHLRIYNPQNNEDIYTCSGLLAESIFSKVTGIDCLYTDNIAKVMIEITVDSIRNKPIEIGVWQDDSSVLISIRKITKQELSDCTWEETLKTYFKLDFSESEDNKSKYEKAVRVLTEFQNIWCKMGNKSHNCKHCEFAEVHDSCMIDKFIINKSTPI